MNTSPPAPDIALLEQAITSIERITLGLLAIYRVQHLGNQITYARLARCWACGADREPGDRGECLNCGVGPACLTTNSPYVAGDWSGYEVCTICGGLVRYDLRESHFMECQAAFLEQEIPA